LAARILAALASWRRSSDARPGLA